MTSRHLSVVIDRPAAGVYDYLCEPANLPAWAAGLSTGIEFVDGRWVSDSPMGRVTVEMAPHNAYGIVDHWVNIGEERFYNPMRVLEHGDGAEVVFTLRLAAGMSQAEFERDAAMIEADLATLKTILESQSRSQLPNK